MKKKFPKKNFFYSFKNFGQSKHFFTEFYSITRSLNSISQLMWEYEE